MNKNKKKLMIFPRIIILSLFALIVLSTSVAKAAIGITPPYLNNDKLLRGDHFEQKISIGFDESLVGNKIKLEVNAPEIKNWISFDKGYEFNIPSGKRSVDVIASVDVPNNAEYKKYTGTITIKNINDKVDGAGVALTLGGEIGISLAVVENKIRDFEVLSYRIPDVISGENTKVFINIKNIGNVNISPTKVAMDLYKDSARQELISSIESSSINKEIEPSKEGEVVAEMPTSKLPTGLYWAKMKIYNGDEIVADFNISFDIQSKSEEAGIKEYSKTSNFIKDFISDKNKMMILALVLLVLIGFVIIRKMSKKDSGKKSKK